jgi:hypothetical protein
MWGHVVIHGYIIYHKYCKQLINILYFNIKGHVRYIIAICQPITKLHMSQTLILVIYVELELQKYTIFDFQKNHSPRGVETHNVFIQ